MDDGIKFVWNDKKPQDIGIANQCLMCSDKGWVERSTVIDGKVERQDSRGNIYYVPGKITKRKWVPCTSRCFNAGNPETEPK